MDSSPERLHARRGGPDTTVGLDLTPVSGPHGIRGIGRYVDGVAMALIREHATWSADHLGLLLAGGQDVPGLVQATWRTSRTPWRPQDIGWLWATVADRIVLRGRRPAIWHLTDPVTPLPPLPPARTAVTVYDLIPLQEPAVLAAVRPHRRMIYRRYLRTVERAGLVIAISEATAQDVQELLHVPTERIRVVHPWVTRIGSRRPPRRPPDLASAVAGRRADRAQGAPGDEDPLFLFVGVPEPHKRADLAIRSLAAHRSRGHGGRLAFIGHHPPGTRAALASLAADLGVLGSVAFLGRLDDEELAGRYERSVLLALSRREGFGLPPVEAVLAGGRVVATPTPIYRELLGDAATFATGDTAAEVAAAMADAAAAPPPTTDVRERLASRFSAQHTADALLDAYESLLRTAR